MGYKGKKNAHQAQLWLLSGLGPFSPAQIAHATIFEWSRLLKMEQHSTKVM